MSQARVHARRVLLEEAAALTQLAERLDTEFDAAVELLVALAGRVVVSGMGKSGHIGRKIAATLASTGTPALFLHPAEAMHGDLGMAAPGDIALVLSNSGESEELRALLPALKRRVSCLIAMTGRPDSTLGRAADLILDTRVAHEACPLNLAPTTSTTTMLALGDALAVAVMEARGFRSEDYARLHPAGSLGRRLLLKVSDIMRHGDELAQVPETASVYEAMTAITRARAGLACIVDNTGRLTGVLSDGDSRRFLVAVGPEAWDRSVTEAMTKTPRLIVGDPLAAEAMESFESGPIRFGDMPVVDEMQRPIGILTLKDLVREGILPPSTRDQ
jgi:arabinose-5-phosphate isomerase